MSVWWDVGIAGCRTGGMSDWWDVGLMGGRNGGCPRCSCYCEALWSAEVGMRNWDTAVRLSCRSLLHLLPSLSLSSPFFSFGLLLHVGLCWSCNNIVKTTSLLL